MSSTQIHSPIDMPKDLSQQEIVDAVQLAVARLNSAAATVGTYRYRAWESACLEETSHTGAIVDLPREMSRYRSGPTSLIVQGDGDIAWDSFYTKNIDDFTASYTGAVRQNRAASDVIATAKRSGHSVVEDAIMANGSRKLRVHVGGSEADMGGHVIDDPNLGDDLNF